jgi:hypothetical protein
MIYGNSAHSQIYPADYEWHIFKKVGISFRAGFPNFPAWLNQGFALAAPAGI